tara:strand:- start:329 stop:670 length:342 start_codon:yes stop_codon:yes gene_type:complete
MKRNLLPLCLSDADRLKSSIRKYEFGKNHELAFVSSLFTSDQFKEGYGENFLNTKHIENYYMNVLEKNCNQYDFNCRIRNLKAGAKNSFDLLLYLTSSTENKDLLVEITCWEI